MHIDIQFLPSLPKPNLLSDRVIVVFDVLRATSVIVHAMSQGAKEIIPVATVEEAFQLVKTVPLGATLLVVAFRLSNYGKDLVVLGLEEDLLYCAQTNITPTHSNIQRRNDQNLSVNGMVQSEKCKE